ncbi:lysosomal acid glucosylceramidase-like [Uloborus diversus]|uniref:lysosomal acid glucosylceramidase-like n=1 Tax=Uloborus diversus TaxID=327109 RepID=UPI0024098882|nr:lysosomal acid glucosylceramidase-like [Uloborus diversus]
MLLLQLFFLLVILFGVEASSCSIRKYGDKNIVCVCNETYCDELQRLLNISRNQVALYETNEDGDRFKSSLLYFTPNSETETVNITVDPSKQYQFILGFGGAFTDAAGINVKSLPDNLQELLFNSYFSQSGLEYNMGRVPIASCDFSTHPYSYADVDNDFELNHFELAKEDFLYKIPLIKRAISLSKDELLLFGSPWSAPAWMKTNNAMNGKGALKEDPEGKYYRTWANYFVRFLQAYKENNITFWGLTTQNEPSDGCLEDFAFQSMCFPAEKQRDFLKNHLGPILQKAGFGIDKLKLMILDDVRVFLPNWVDVVLKDKSAAQYVAGVAYHWYTESLMPHKLLDITHQKYSNVFYLATEACTGSYFFEFPKVSLGNWQRAERYAHDILNGLNNWSIGWIDWNLALDEQGGPNWVKNYVDAPIIINSTSNEFYKQPMYYALAQFSKCLPRGSYRIGLNLPSERGALKNLDIGAFQTPEDKRVLIVVNRGEVAVNFNMFDASKGYLNVTAKPHSVQTYEYLIR